MPPLAAVKRTFDSLTYPRLTRCFENELWLEPVTDAGDANHDSPVFEHERGLGENEAMKLTPLHQKLVLPLLLHVQ